MKERNRKRNRKRDRGLSLLLAVVVFFSGVLLPIPSAEAATSSKIRVSDYIRIMVQATGLEIDETKSSPYLQAAMSAGIVKTGEYKDYKAYLTRTDAAVILNRADEYLYGDTVDGKLLKTVLENRISDISKITKSKREAVAKVYAKGFMKGYSNGYYIKSREIRGNESMTVSGARGLVAMLKDTKKRSGVSPDGQVIRTTNLPKNAKDYEYILATYPNSFYEMKFSFQTSKYYYEPKELVDYARPSQMSVKMMNLEIGEDGKCIYIDEWINKVEINLKTRLNVNYENIDNSWLNRLKNTYFNFKIAEIDKELTDDIKKYIQYVKKNKVTIKSSVITVEPSTMYFQGAAYRVRVYVKFKVSFPAGKLEQENLFYGRVIQLYNFKEDTWFSGVYDISIATKNGNSNGYDYSVSDDSFNDYFYKGEGNN